MFPGANLKYALKLYNKTQFVIYFDVRLQSEFAIGFQTCSTNYWELWAGCNKILDGLLKHGIGTQSQCLSALGSVVLYVQLSLSKPQATWQRFVSAHNTNMCSSKTSLYSTQTQWI